MLRATHGLQACQSRSNQDFPSANREGIRKQAQPRVPISCLSLALRPMSLAVRVRINFYGPHGLLKQVRRPMQETGVPEDRLRRELFEFSSTRVASAHGPISASRPACLMPNRWAAAGAVIMPGKQNRLSLSQPIVMRLIVSARVRTSP